MIIRPGLFVLEIMDPSGYQDMSSKKMENFLIPSEGEKENTQKWKKYMRR